LMCRDGVLVTPYAWNVRPRTLRQKRTPEFRLRKHKTNVTARERNHAKTARLSENVRMQNV
jgi:hypothetical protein